MRNGGRGEWKRNSPERHPNLFTQRPGRERVRHFPESAQRDLLPKPWPEGRETVPQRHCKEPPQELTSQTHPQPGGGKESKQGGEALDRPSRKAASSTQEGETECPPPAILIPGD